MKSIKRDSIVNVLGITVIFFINLLFNFWICKGDRVFYCDDLFLITKFRNHNFAEFVFPTNSSKIRPASNALIWIVLKLFGHHYELIDEFLLALHFANAMLVYFFVFVIYNKKDCIVRTIASSACAILFIASRLAYYNISEVLGIMESTALGLAIGMLFMLYCFMVRGGRQYLTWASVLYVVLIFTHERYFVLIFLYGIVFLFDKEMGTAKKRKGIIVSVAVLCLFWGMRLFLLGKNALEGTGYISIVDTFQLSTAIKYCFAQVGYILGFNCGPQYLNGIEAGAVPLQINVLLLFNLIVVLGIALPYMILLIRNKTFRHENFNKFVLFVMFIGLCIICSSTTIRVEMRWIYVSYAAFLIMLFQMISALLQYNPLYFCQTKKKVVLGLYFVSVLVTEQFYRNHYRYLYYWDDKDFSREIYNTVMDKYDTELETKTIIIVGDFWKENGRGPEEWKTFWDPYISAESICVTYVEDIYEALQLVNEHDNSIVLVEDYENRRYVDITDKIAQMKYLYGKYDDGWCEQEMAFLIHTGDISKLEVSYMTQRQQNVTITVNERYVKTVRLNEGEGVFDIPCSSNIDMRVILKSDYAAKLTDPDQRVASYLLLDIVCVE